MKVQSRKHESEESRNVESGGPALRFDELSSKIIAAAIEVHKRLGPGFVEAVYERALQLELNARGIGFEAQKRIDITYGGEVVGTQVLDMVVDGRIVVELKAVSAFDSVHFGQLRSYLRAANSPVGLLLNFGTQTLSIKRIVN